MTDVTGDYLALRREVGAHRDSCDVVVVEGPDARSFLQGQLSADLDQLGSGDSVRSLLLDPQGKLVAWLRVWARDDDLVLEAGRGAGIAVLERLRRFLLRVDAHLHLDEWELVSLRGPSTPPAASLGGADVLADSVDWAGLPGVDLMGPSVPDPEVRRVGEEAFTSVRIESGWPATGAEIPVGGEPTLIPAELGELVIDSSVSFTKGCYTGQELVARIDSRGGRTPRRLRGVVLGTNVVPPVGARVVVDGAEKGVLTSVGESLDLRAPVALGLVHRSVDPGTTVTLTWDGADDGDVPAQVRELPLLTA